MSKTPTQSTRLTALEARQTELERRIAELERAATRQLPIPWTAPTNRTYPTYPQFPTPVIPNDIESCHICGNKWKDMTHYVCNNDRCPSRVTCGDVSPTIFTCGGISPVGPHDAPSTISIPVNGGRFGDTSHSYFDGAIIHTAEQTSKKTPQ